MYKDYKDLPDFFKHVVMALYHSGDFAGSKEIRFNSCLNVARSRLTQYGFLQEGSDTGPLTDLKFTAKGARRCQNHKSEGPAKSAEFDSLMKLMEAAPDGLPPPQPRPLRPNEKSALRKQVDEVAKQKAHPPKKHRAGAQAPKVKRAKRVTRRRG